MRDKPVMSLRCLIVALPVAALFWGIVIYLILG